MNWCYFIFYGARDLTYNLMHARQAHSTTGLYSQPDVVFKEEIISFSSIGFILKTIWNDSPLPLFPISRAASSG